MFGASEYVGELRMIFNCGDEANKGEWNETNQKRVKTYRGERERAGPTQNMTRKDRHEHQRSFDKVTAQHVPRHVNDISTDVRRSFKEAIYVFGTNPCAHPDVHPGDCMAIKKCARNDSVEACN